MEDRIYTVEIDYYDQGLLQEEDYDIMSTSAFNAIDFIKKTIVSDMIDRGCELIGMIVVKDWSLKEYVIEASIANRLDMIISEESIDNR